ncbi:hypothetical protein GGI1_05705, partial [Acidithiobacillus sp. GGI-221]
AGLQEIGEFRIAPRHRRLEDAENGPHADADIGIAGTVQRIKKQQILAARDVAGMG